MWTSSSSTSTSTNAIIALICLFVISGVLQPILIELLNYNGAAEKTTMLFVLPNYLGMSLSIFANWKSRKQGRFRRKEIASLCLMDLISQFLNLFGLILAGSLLYSVIYASCTVWTALFSRILLNRRLHTMQWVGVVTVFTGLMCGVGGSIRDGNDTRLGVILILIGSMVHSLTYIVSEKLLAVVSDPISPEMLSSVMGFFGVLVYGAWQLIYTIPNFDRVVVNEIYSHHGSVAVIIVAFIALVLVNMLHALCFFNVISSAGATTTGILKGVQTVLVFLSSHFAFCSIQSSQCFTVAKGVSVVVVSVGVVLYSSFKLPANDPSYIIIPDQADTPNVIVEEVTQQVDLVSLTGGGNGKSLLEIEAAGGNTDANISLTRLY